MGVEVHFGDQAYEVDAVRSGRGLFVGKAQPRAGWPSHWFTLPRSRQEWTSVEFAAVAGYDLYMVAEDDFDWRSLIKASLKEGEVYPRSRGPRDRTTWRRTMQCFREGPVPVAVAALALKSAVLEHPWSLGHFVRLLPAGPARALAGTPELLPIHFPPFISKAEEEAGSLLEKWVSGRKPLGEVDLELIHDGAVDAFLWLIVMALNYMYVGGPAVQWQCIRCPALHSPAQVAAVERLRTLATIMVDEGGSLNAMAWDDQRRPPEEYWGHAVQKAHALSWRAVEGSLPPASRETLIPLEKLVGEKARAALLDPSLLRLPEDAVADPLPKAKVLVESQDEWEKIVAELCFRGIAEPEIPAETVTHRGKPVYNGAFGVHKKFVEVRSGEAVVTQRILRLIVNLVPTNALQRSFGGEAREMGYPGLWPSICLCEDELMVMSGEDQKGCFHLYLIPEAWRGYFVLERTVSRKAAGLPTAGPPIRVRIRTCPMGWINAVDFIQEAHRRMVTEPAPAGAGIDPSRLIRMGHRMPPMIEALPINWFSVYVDNFDQGTIILKTWEKEYTFTSSGAQVALREAYAFHGVQRDEAKAGEGTLVWETLGAQLRGRDGLLGSSSARKAAVMGSLLHLLAGKVVDMAELATVIGKLIFLFQFSRPLMSILEETFSFIQALGETGGRHPLPDDVAEELLLCAMVLPSAWIDLRAHISEEVVATDASEEGGGACVSTGVTPIAAAKLAALQSGSSTSMACSGLLVVSFRDGMGGLSAAVELTGVAPDGIIFVEKSKLARKVVKKHWPTAITYDDINAVTPEVVKRWWDWFPSVRRVLIGGGLPWQGLSGVNASRESLTDPRAQLVHSVLDIVAEVRKNPGVDVFEIYESVASIIDKDMRELSTLLEVRPVFVEAANVGPCKRTRLYWIRGGVAPGPDASVITSSDWPDWLELKVDRVRTPPLASFLEPLAKPLVPKELPFQSFLRPFKRTAPPKSPAGVEQSSSLAKKRWKHDSYRLPPYQYEDGNLVTDKGGPRRLKADEQARMLGFPSHYLDIVKKFAGLHQLEDNKGWLVGGSYSVIGVARLVYGFTASKSVVESEEGTGSLTWLWKQWGAWDARERESFTASRGTWSQQHKRPVLAPASPILAGEDTVVICSPAPVEMLRAALCSVKWPNSKHPYEWGKSATLGLQRPDQVIVDDGSCLGPMLCPLINGFLRSHLQEKNLEFTWSSLQVNYNTESGWHADGTTVGLSAIWAVGDFSGGELEVEGGAPIAIKNVIRFFDGRKQHRLLPFDGTRISIVAFFHRDAADAPRSLIQKMVSLGFAPVPQVGLGGAGAPLREQFTVGPKLVAEYLRLIDDRGSDVRLDVGIPFGLCAWPRCPIDARSWSWKVAQSYQWRASAHVNILEVRAVLDFARHIAKAARHHTQRKLFLLDSQAALRVLTEGRSSVRLLNADMKRLAAIFKVANILPLFGWVPGALIPADGPSP